MNLDPASLKKRERIILDIAKREKKESEDITRWHSEKRKRAGMRSIRFLTSCGVTRQ